MREKNTEQMTIEEMKKFNRRFKLAIYAYAAIELAAIAVAVYCKIYR